MNVSKKSNINISTYMFYKKYIPHRISFIPKQKKAYKK